MTDRCWLHHIMEKECDDMHLPDLVKLVVGPKIGGAGLVWQVGCCGGC